jgi:hypothetical protein
MALPEKPVTLTVEQVAELNQRLSTLRHDVNNNLLLIMASAELASVKPEALAQSMDTLLAQPQKITEQMTRFTAEFERILGITRV